MLGLQEHIAKTRMFHLGMDFQKVIKLKIQMLLVVVPVHLGLIHALKHKTLETLVGIIQTLRVF